MQILRNGTRNDRELFSIDECLDLVSLVRSERLAFHELELQITTLIKNSTE